MDYKTDKKIEEILTQMAKEREQNRPELGVFSKVDLILFGIKKVNGGELPTLSIKTINDEEITGRIVNLEKNYFLVETEEKRILIAYRYVVSVCISNEDAKEIKPPVGFKYD